MINYPQISLVSVYDTQEPEASFFARELYYLLGERTPEENISHKEMPSWQRHLSFIKAKSYKEWYLIQNMSAQTLGTVYITTQNEIGISIFKIHRNKGWASAAICAILKNNPNQSFIANINPKNEKSKRLFKKFGFHHIQDTYRREPT